MYVQTLKQMERETGSAITTEGFGLIPLVPLAIGIGGAAIGAATAWAATRPAVDEQGNPQTATGILSDRVGRGVSTALTIAALGFVAYKWMK